MLDLKKELLKKQKESDEKRGDYNKVVNDNLEVIKEIFNNSEFEVNTFQEKDKSITLELRQRDSKGYCRFTYDCLINRKTQLLNEEIDISYIETQLKYFILDITTESNIKIEEGIGVYKIGIKIELPDNTFNEIMTIGEIVDIDYVTQEIVIEFNNGLWAHNKEYLDNNSKVIE